MEGFRGGVFRIVPASYRAGMNPFCPGEILIDVD
jgi:hypothetical protein